MERTAIWPIQAATAEGFVNYLQNMSFVDIPVEILCIVG